MMNVAEKAHWISKCPKCEEDEKKNDTSTTNFATSKLQNLEDWRIGEVYMVGSRGRETSTILLDCEGSTRMFCNHAFFSTYTSTTLLETISQCFC